jgi:putative PIN family toxin of toxin-antitoxin system
VERIERISESLNCVECRDVNDQKFIQLAMAGKADVLVTGDEDLLMLKDQTPFDIQPSGIP